MKKDDMTRLYWAWGSEFAAYGPVELPALIQWIKRERVRADTWIYRDPDNVWSQAQSIPELKMFFAESAAPAPPGLSARRATLATFDKIAPGALRRLKLFAAMSDTQLEAFAKYVDVVSVAKNSVIIKQGEHGDAMFLILSGEARASITVDGKEIILSTLGIGDFFGEVSLLDEGPRSADVLANEDSLLLIVSSTAFRQMVEEAPFLASPFLYNLSRSVVSRMRSLTRRYEDSVHCLHLVSQYYSPALKKKGDQSTE